VQGIDLEERWQGARRDEQLWGRFWHLKEWDAAVRQFPSLKMPLKWRAKRKVRRWMHHLGLLGMPLR
jgi:hypothetical protein